MSTAQRGPISERAAAPLTLPALPTAVGLTWRALTPADVPAWLTLATVVEDADHALERSTEHELREQFEGSWRDAARDSIGGFDADGALRVVGWSDFRPVPAGTLAPELSGAVHPDLRGRGIGSALVRWLEARARQQLAAAGDSTLPARIRFYIYEHRSDARAVAEAAGFTPIRWFVDMRRDLSAPLPEVTVAAGFAIEPYTDERADEVRVTYNEAFVPDHWGSNPYDAEAWALHTVRNDKFRRDWSFVVIATDTGRMVGYLLSGAYDQDWAAQGYTEGWTDILAVRREARGRGLAAALLVAAMRAYATGGMQYAGLDVDTDNPSGAFGLYSRLGYERRRGTVLYTKEL